jgi:DNA-binding transcriptional LysR family regulator
MDVRQLVVFVTVLDQDGFSRAADELEIAQPSVSQAIRELESDLGVVLFHRLGRSIRPTAAAEILEGAARRALRELEDGRRAVAEVSRLERGRLELACLPTLAMAPLAPLVGAFRRVAPEIMITLSDPQDTMELLGFIRAGRCEIGLVDHTEVEDLVSVPLEPQEFVVVLPPGSPSVGDILLRDFAAMPIVATPRGTSTRWMLDDALASVGTRPEVAIEAHQREALLPLIASGAGAGLLPAPLSTIASALGCVVRNPIPRVRRAVALVHRDAPLTPAGARFVELARTHRDASTPLNA